MTMVKTANRTVIDPVCGMEVDPARVPQTRQVMGRVFYFCSNYCAQVFDPEMGEPELGRMRTAMGCQGCQPHRTPVLWAMGMANGTIKNLIYFLGR